MNGNQREFLGHPVALYMLFFAELWERFSFYGMRALLVFHVVDLIGRGEEFAHHTYGAYTGFVYATTLIGGLLADRFLGYRKAVFWGGILMAAGQFSLAFRSPTCFYVALGLLVTGNGFFKPNISTIVGKLYPPGDIRRDSAFSIFYIGINLGASSGPILCGLVKKYWGAHPAFALAGVGMLTGLSVFWWGQHLLGSHGLPPAPERFRERTPLGLSKLHGLYLGSIAFAALAAYLIANPRWVIVAVPYVGVGFVGYIIYEAFRSTPQERSNIFAILLLEVFTVVFWACFEQHGSSFNLFTEKHTTRSLFGWQIEASMFQATNATFIVVLAGVFAWMWLKLARRGLEPSSPLKFALALLQVGAGFIPMVIAARLALDSPNGKTTIGWVILAYLIHTTAELCISPVGLSTITRLAPARLGGLLMGSWFLSSAFALVLAGWIAGLTDPKNAGFERVFTNLIYFGMGAGVLLLLLVPLLKKLQKNPT